MNIGATKHRRKNGEDHRCSSPFRLRCAVPSLFNRWLRPPFVGYTELKAALTIRLFDCPSPILRRWLRFGWTT